MGTICANNFQKQEGTQTVDTYKNMVQMQVQLGELCTVSFILGHYKQHRSDALVAVTQNKQIQHCDPIRQYTSDPQKTTQIISNMRKSFYKAITTKNCPYRKLLICVLPPYHSEDQQQYIQQWRNLIRQSLQASKDLTFEFMNTIEGVHNLHNQLLLALLFEQLIVVKSNVKVYLITTEKKMMNLYRFQMMKTEKYSIKPVLE